MGEAVVAAATAGIVNQAAVQQRRESTTNRLSKRHCVKLTRRLTDAEADRL
jgi:hypothetical protein